MKSKVISYPAIESIALRPDQRMVDRSFLEQEIEEEIEFIKREHSEIKERAIGENLEAGDAVVIDASCSEEGAPGKFNKAGIGLKLCSNFYDSKIESTLIGTPLGGSTTVDAGADGEWPVTVKTVSASHSVLVPLRDDDYKAAGAEYGADVASEEGFREFLRASAIESQNINHFFDNIFDELSADMTSKAVFEIDEEEMETEIEAWVMAEGELESVEELPVDTRKHYEEIFKFNLILADLAKDMPAPTEEEFREVLNMMLEQGYAEAELAALDDYDRYVYDFYVDEGQTILRKELEKQYESRGDGNGL